MYICNSIAMKKYGMISASYVLCMYVSGLDSSSPPTNGAALATVCRHAAPVFHRRLFQATHVAAALFLF